MSDFFKLENVSKQFGKLQALSKVDFEVKQGEVLGLIGPNGAGKTTLFNVATGFYHCSSGSVTFKGKDVTRAAPNKLAAMGMIRTFQIPRPFRKLSVHDNVAVGTLFNKSRIQNLSLPNREFIQQILKGVKLSAYQNEPASLLGYSNQKLLELGRARGAVPDFLLLDEPFAGLSANEIQSVSQILIDLAGKGLTLMIVEHKLRELMKLVNRVIVLYYGKLIADGSPEDISKDERVLKAYLGRRWSRSNA